MYLQYVFQLRSLDGIRQANNHIMETLTMCYFSAVFFLDPDVTDRSLTKIHS